MKKYKTKVEIVYENLKEDIVSGIFKPGERIVISQIAKLNEVSDIPVREAIRILASENLITILPNVGPIVSEIEEEDVIEHFMIRGILEGYASRLSIDYITEEKAVELQSIIEKMKKSITESNLKEYGELNKLFHCSIYESIPYPTLYRMIIELWDRWERTRSVFVLAPERLMESIGEHEKILELIKEKKYDEVESFIRDHKMHAATRLYNYLHNKAQDEGGETKRS